MNTGKIISDLRDQKSWPQSELVIKNSISRVMIGKYEREEAIPSIEVAKRLPRLSKELLIISLAKEPVPLLIKRIQQIEDLPESDRTHLLVIIDAFLRDARKAYGQ